MAEGKTVRMIRIANDFGDICYDFEAFSGVPQRAGIISHLRLSKPIALLIHNTNQKTAPFIEQYRVVCRCINLMKGTRTTNG
jgi:hypothetical protein